MADVQTRFLGGSSGLSWPPVAGVDPTRSEGGPLDYDLIVRNGCVVDGPGLPRRRIDVGVRNGRIVKLARLTNATATEEIDAAGLIVAPGIVGAHTHYE